MEEIVKCLYKNQSLTHVREVIPKTLYFATYKHTGHGSHVVRGLCNTNMHFFSTHKELVYHKFNDDFGPLNIANLYKFCRKLMRKLARYARTSFHEKLKTSRFGKMESLSLLREYFVRRKVVVYYTSTNDEDRANSAFLISAFAVLYLGFSPHQAYKILQPGKHEYRPFQDASHGSSPDNIQLFDCLSAIHKASIFGFFNFNDFDIKEFTRTESFLRGNINWIIPGKFLALPSPVQSKQSNNLHHTPVIYIEYFLSNNVTDIIRLNRKVYDCKHFTKFGINHYDMYMLDGSNPQRAVVKNFFRVTESARGAIAVHCKAGLGRTGTLISAYLMKHYRMTAKEAIGWVRICRSGSVIGTQQRWLEKQQEELWIQGSRWRRQQYGKTNQVPYLDYGIYSHLAPKKHYPGLHDLINKLATMPEHTENEKVKAKKKVDLVK